MRNNHRSAQPRTITPVPDPTELTTQQLQREIANTRELVSVTEAGIRDVLEVRLDAMSTRFERLRGDVDRMPLVIKEEVAQLRELLGKQFEAVEAKFAGIATQFAERDKRADQIADRDKAGLVSALEAQKDAFRAQNENNASAIAKMEANFVKLIEQGQSVVKSISENFEGKINDIKSRLDKGEGRGSIVEPAISGQLSELTRAVAELSQGAAASTAAAATRAKGAAEHWGSFGVIGGMGVALLTAIIIAVAAMLKH